MKKRFLSLLVVLTLALTVNSLAASKGANAKPSLAERCETFVSKEMARMPVPLKMAIRTENSRPEITGAGIANLRSTWDRRTMARPQK